VPSASRPQPTSVPAANSGTSAAQSPQHVRLATRNPPHERALSRRKNLPSIFRAALLERRPRLHLLRSCRRQPFGPRPGPEAEGRCCWSKPGPPRGGSNSGPSQNLRWQMLSQFIGGAQPFSSYRGGATSSDYRGRNLLKLSGGAVFHPKLLRGAQSSPSSYRGCAVFSAGHPLEAPNQPTNSTFQPFFSKYPTTFEQHLV
jgi:hypothetical protein